MSDLAVPTDAPHADGMAAPVLSNFVVGVVVDVVDRARKMSSMFVGVFFAFPDPFPGGWSSAVIVVVGGDSPSKKGPLLDREPDRLDRDGGTGWYWLKIVIPRCCPLSRSLCRR